MDSSLGRFFQKMIFWKKFNSLASYFYTCRDQFNLMIYCLPLKQKKSAVVKEGFIRLFEENQLEPSTLSTDQGGEFTALHKWFKSRHIHPILRRGENKASLAEEVG